MALFSKKKEVKELPKFESPLFPEIPRDRGISEISELPSLPSLSNQPSEMSPRKFTMDIGEMRIGGGVARLKEPIFIKIDKFRDALSNLELIKKRLQESSELLDKIKAIRSDEEEELEKWSQEINMIKEKVDLIDKKLFSEIEQ